MSIGEKNISIKEVPIEKQEELKELLMPYLKEIGAEPNYPYLPYYWNEATRFPYFITQENNIIGFALVRQLSEKRTFQLAEFYILPEHRRTGLGNIAALNIFKKHLGNWRLSAFTHNKVALQFWESVLNNCGTDVSKMQDSDKVIFTFSVLD